MNLMNLLQAAGAIPPTMAAPDQGPDIQVQAPAPVVRGQTIDDRPMVKPTFGREVIPREGMFGVKGTLRDVLGTIGDAFLVQSGNKAAYAPRRQMEREGSAMQGFTDNPQAYMEAVERMNVVNPAAAQDMYKEGIATQKLDSQIKTAAQKAAIDSSAKGIQLIGQMAGASNPETYERMRPIMQNVIEKYGLGEEFQLPEKFDKDLMSSYQYGGMPAQAQVSDVRKVEDREIRKAAAQTAESGRDRRAAIAEAGRNKRFQPRAAPRAPQPTAASIAAPLIEKIRNGGKLTPAEESVLTRTGFSADRGKPKKKFTMPALPPGF